MRPFPLSRAVLSRAGAMAHLTPRRVRMRLTLLYGSLFVALGVVLLTITYLLVARSTGRLAVFTKEDVRPSGPLPEDGDRGTYLGDEPPAPESLPREFRELREQAGQQHQETMEILLVQSAVALAIMSVLAMVLGWLVAGRVLRPLRTMTTTIRQISARNVHERLAAGGPRDEMKDLADTVDGLLGRLESALDSHKRFVANAAHELRTPLTLEHALLEEALIDRGATAESFRSNYEKLLKMSEQQGRLLESLLTLSTSERGLDRTEELDLSVLARERLRAVRRDSDRQGLRVETSIEPARATGDAALVDRLVANLLDNAVVHNLPGGHLEVTSGTRAGRAFVRVANTGTDIPPAQVDRLLHPFERLVRTAGDGHHGLGLSIVHAIATAHDATLTAQARQGGGLTVEVSFPPPRTRLPARGRGGDLPRRVTGRGSVSAV